MNQLITLESLLNHVESPMTGSAWGCDELTFGLITRALQGSHTIDSPYSDPYSDTFENTAWNHAQRIAHLVQIGWSDAIELDIGCCLDHVEWYPVQDGHHRICAALYRSDYAILASISGSVDLMERLFTFVDDSCDVA